MCEITSYSNMSHVNREVEISVVCVKYLSLDVKLEWTRGWLWSIENHRAIQSISIVLNFIVVLLQLSQFPPCPSPLFSTAPLTPHSHSQSPPSCPCSWVIYTCSLTQSFLFFLPFSPRSPVVTVSLFLFFMPLLLFSSFVLFFRFLLQMRSYGTWK